jgi:cyclophilin family peptidyl-prolyl cis-trans isomerase
MPSEKRARQRAGREARLAAQAKHDKRRKTTRNVIIVVVAAAVIIGIVALVSGNNKKKPANAAATSSTTTSTTAPTSTTSSANAAAQAAANTVAVKAGCPSSPATTVNTQKYSAAPAMTIDPTKNYTATVVTTAGTFTMALNAKTTPVTVNNFVFLANKGYYHCVIFHRVIPNFMDQTGDPTGTGSGGPGYTIKSEDPAKAANAADQYPIGSVAMANSNSPATTDPSTNGSQFFIVTGSEGEDLSPDYTLFGKVTSGMSVVDKINAGGSTSSSETGTPVTLHRMVSVTVSES